MPNLVNRQGPQGYIPSGESQGPSAKQRLQSMMQGAPNSVLMMIARILGRDQQPQQGPQNSETPEGQWQRMYQMPPGIPGVNPDFMRPTEPPQTPMLNQHPGFIRGAAEDVLNAVIPSAEAADPRQGRPVPAWAVIDIQTGRPVGQYATLKRAHNVANKRDLEYGAVKHVVKPLEK